MQNISSSYCERCKLETHFVPIYKAIKLTGVSRSTVYYWIAKEWVHWVKLPSGRKLICEASLRLKQPEAMKLLVKGAAA